jgi:predicted acylesterase/phospholipase RssA
MTDPRETTPGQTRTAIDTGPIALCLSGGGFRATFFHLGVVRLLNEARLLGNVKYVFSVSGGSILAAHMARKWNDYTSEDQQTFDRVAAELIEFGLWDLRGRITRRYLLGQSRTRNLEKYYSERITDKNRLDTPRCEVQFHILATSLNTGRLCSFTFGKGRAHITIIAEQNNQHETIPADSFPLAKAVAASSAFPPLFPPVALSKSDFGFLGDDEFRRVGPDYLTDGGVFDNLGVSRIDKLVANEERDGIRLILVSDASAMFDYVGSTRYSSLFRRTLRTTDILMYRIASFENALWRDGYESRILTFSIRDVVHRFDLTSAELSGEDGAEASQRQFEPQMSTVQRYTRRVRTDLDEFDPNVIRALMKHGYEVAAHTMVSHDERLKSRISAHPWELASTNGDLPSVNASIDDQEKALNEANRRRIRFSNPNDPIWKNLIRGILVTMVGIIVLSWVLLTQFQELWTQ